MRVKYFPKLFASQGTIFGPNKTPNRLTNWMCRRHFSHQNVLTIFDPNNLLHKGTIFDLKIFQIVQQIGCVGDALDFKLSLVGLNQGPSLNHIL